MKYEKILQAFQKQPTEFLSACVTKFRDTIGEAIQNEDKELEELSRKQLAAVKDILTMRLG